MPSQSDIVPVPVSPGPVRGRLSRAGWKLAGYGFVLLGGIGMAVPLMPTTIFWILAVLCLLRAGDQRAGRLLAHPRYGAPVRLFLEQGAISRRGKAFALSGLLLSAAVLAPLAASQPVAVAAGWAVLALVGAWLATRPEPRTVRVRSGA